VCTTLSAEVYNYFRDYFPDLGRYGQSDLIGLRGGINTYAYVANSPLVNADPDGLQIPMPPPPMPLPGASPGQSGADAIARGIMRLLRGHDEEKGCCPACPDPPPPRIDRVPPSKPHYPCTGDHWSYFEYHQASYPQCTCRLVQRFGGCLTRGGYPPGWSGGQSPRNPPSRPDRDW
jgi:hypothetical protein